MQEELCAGLAAVARAGAEGTAPAERPPWASPIELASRCVELGWVALASDRVECARSLFAQGKHLATAGAVTDEQLSRRIDTGLGVCDRLAG